MGNGCGAGRSQERDEEPRNGCVQEVISLKTYKGAQINELIYRLKKRDLQDQKQCDQD
jgi:hypothetical protein